MQYLLIDNCCLRDLIDKYTFSRHLQSLEDLVQQGEVTLLSTESLLAEWNNHKAKWQHDCTRRLKSPSQNQAQAKDQSLTKYDAFENLDDQHIAKQVMVLDRLLTESTRVPVPDIITSETHNRIKDKKAPFHNNKSSFNDWEIFGSAAEYCKVHGIQSLIFVSKNTREFSDEANKENLHPSLSTRFPRLKIIYCTSINTFFSKAHSKNLLIEHLLDYSIIRSAKFSFNTSLRSNVLDGLYDLYNTLYSEINFIPFHILKKYYPFSKKENATFIYYDLWGFSGVNEELISFFESFTISDDSNITITDASYFKGIQDPENKIKYVIPKLLNNLIFTLSAKGSNKTIEVPQKKQYRCDSNICEFSNFNFLTVFKYLEQTENSAKGMLEQAYLHYKIGNYLASYKIYKKILESKSEIGLITYFITKYNLKHLGSFLQNIFANKIVDDNIIAELKRIDPTEEAVKLKGRQTDYDLLLFIAQEDFFNNSYQKAKDFLDKIREHYTIQLKDGYSTNNFIWGLIIEFASVDSFLNSNYIIFDTYSNFGWFFNMLVEGLFASYAIKDTQGSRFSHFDDFWLSKFIMYGNRDEIIRHFRRYNITKIKYAPSEESNDAKFEELIANLFTDSGKLMSSFNKTNDGNNISFASLYNKYFQNFLTTVSLLDLDNELVEKISRALLSFLKTEEILHRISFESIRFFLGRFRGKISTPTTLRLFTLFYSHEKYHEDSLFNICIKILPKNIKLNISKKNILKLISPCTSTCPKCHTKHNFPFVIDLFGKANDTGKRIITQHLEASLESKFDFEIFYISSVYEIISVNEERVIQLVSDIKPEAIKKQHYFFGGRNMMEIDYYEKLLNLCFKLNLDTTLPLFEGIKTTNLYYQWLLNMDNFNYEQFDLTWVGKDQTKFFYQKMSTSEKFKSFLKEYLFDKNDSSLEWLLLKITLYL